jgi:hypothetical protein
MRPAAAPLLPTNEVLDFGTSRWQLKVERYIISRTFKRGLNDSYWPAASLALSAAGVALPPTVRQA